MKELIASGARHPLTVIRNFAAHERRYELGEQNGKFFWEPAAAITNAKELLPSGTPAFRESSLRGQYLDIPYHVEDQAPNFLVDFIATQGPFDLVVELGCGYGRILFNLAYSGVPLGTRFVGGELTQSGVEAVNGIAALDPDLDLSVRHFDFLDPDLSWVKPGKRCLVYTCHAIEQVHRIDQRLIDAMCSLGESVTAVHLEPFAFQVQPNLGPATQKQRLVLLGKRWNANLVEVLRGCADAGTIGLEYLATDIFLPIASWNATSLAIWSKK